MKDLLPFIISGIATGSVFGLAGIGLTLTYRTSGIFNFGHGAIATVAAYCYYWLHVDHGLPWGVSMFLSVVVLGPVFGLVMELIARKLSMQNTAHKVVGTVGLIVAVQGFGTLKYGNTARPVEQYLPHGTFTIFDTAVSWDQVIVFGVALVAMAGLYGMLNFTRSGLVMRAVVDDPDLLNVQGTDPVRVRRLAWMIGTMLAALSGVLILPYLGLDALALTFLVVQAFGAAAFGIFKSIPLTFAGGIILGIGSDVSKKYVLSVPQMGGVPGALPFLVLVVLLLVLPRHKLVPPNAVEHRPRIPYKGPLLLRLSAGVVFLLPMLAVPLLVGVKLPYFTLALVQAILILSLGLLVRTSGQVSLCHAAFMAVGACVFSQLTIDHGVPWLAAALVGALVAIFIGALVSIPAIRLSGLFLALATFGFGIMFEKFVFPLNIMFSTGLQGRAMPRPSFAQSDFRFYYVVLACLVVTAIAVAVIHEGRLGRVLRGISDSPLALSSLGLSVNVTRVIVFCISAFFAGLGGILYGSQVHYAVAGDAYFLSFESLLLIVMLALAPFRDPWLILPAFVGTVIPAYVASGNTLNVLNVMFGVSAVMISVNGGHAVMPRRWRGWFDRRFTLTRAPSSSEIAAEAAAQHQNLQRTEAHGGTGLQIDQVRVRFGGLVALDGLSLDAPLGRVTGLIGPNGAGKTTAFNVCGGLTSPTSGTVRLNGTDLRGKSAAKRARLGLGRTFQRMALCDTMTVLENVMMGREASQAGDMPFRHLAAPRREHRMARSAALEAMEQCGIAGLANRQAGELSTGQRRLVELARCLAGPFDILLLDEPSSGLDRTETERLGEILRDVVRERGCGILIVEHDMSLVVDVCEYVYVLDFGRLIFEGTPSDVAADPVVRSAYLGTATEELAGASGSPLATPGER